MSICRLHPLFSFVLLLLAVAGPQPSQAQGNDALQALPPAQRVVEDMRGANDRDSAARATAALQALEGVVTSLAGPRAAAKQFTPAEQARIDEYGQAHRAIWAREYDRLAACEGDQCPRYLYARCSQGYFFSAPFYRELLDRYLPPDWQARHLSRLQGKLWKDAAALPAGTRVPAEVGSRLPCAGAGQATRAVATTGVSSFGALVRDVLGPRATMDNPSFRAFLGELAMGLGIGLALLALWVVGYVRQFARRVSFDLSDPPKVHVSPARDLHVVTGIVLGTSKGIETTITTTYDQNNNVSGRRANSIVHDQFFIRTPEGAEKAIKLAGFDVAVRDGQLMSAVWTTLKGNGQGQYLMLRNHNLRSSTYFDGSERKLLGVRYRYLWLTVLTLLALSFFLAVSLDEWLPNYGDDAMLVLKMLSALAVIIGAAMGIAQWVSTAMRLKGLRRQIEERLVPELDRRADDLPLLRPASFTRAS